MNVEKPIEIGDIPNLTTENTREQTAEAIFQDLYDLEQIKAIMQERFTNAYLLVVNPHNTTDHQNNSYIQDLISKYQKYGEHRPLNILILKKNPIISPEMQQKYEEMKAIYGEMVQKDNKEYAIIIGFFGGTTGRTNQVLIDDLLANYPIIKIH